MDKLLIKKIITFLQLSLSFHLILGHATIKHKIQGLFSSTKKELRSKGSRSKFVGDRAWISRAIASRFLKGTEFIGSKAPLFLPRYYPFLFENQNYYDPIFYIQHSALSEKSSWKRSSKCRTYKIMIAVGTPRKGFFLTKVTIPSQHLLPNYYSLCKAEDGWLSLFLG